MQFVQFSVIDNIYQDSLKLREEHLRIPFGLKLSQNDTLNDSEQFHYGICDDAILVASVSIKIIDFENVQLRQMAVSQKYQGKYIGAKLISLTEKELKDKGYKRITMDARVSAMNFYNKQGYSPEGKIYDHIGIDHIKMKKRIE